MKKITAFLLGLGFLLCTSLAFGIDVHFQWGASTGVVDGYRIYYGESLGGPYPERLCEVNGTTLNYTASFDDYDPGEVQEYYLVCRAFNACGESGDSNEIHLYHAIPGSPGSFQWSIDLAEIVKSLGADRIKFMSKE
jgi:hypothetical protein